MKRYWHYTVYGVLISILKDGEIKVATQSVMKGEKPAVWLSTNPVWEETVRKAYLNKETGEQTEPLSRDELFERGDPPIRIKVDPSRVNLKGWKNHKKKSGLLKKYAKGLESIAKKWGADPSEWYVSYEPIPLTSCLFPIEIWDSKRWVNIEKVLE